MPGSRFPHVALGGYLVRPATREDAGLTHVGRDTPAGELLRRFWQPIALVGELGDVPLAVRVLGEDLVLFRDLGGRLVSGGALRIVDNSSWAIGPAGYDVGRAL